MIISLDTETTGVDFVHGVMPFLVTTCDQDGVIRFWEWEVDPLTRRPQIPDSDLADIAELIDAANLIYLHNAKFDVRALAKIGIDLPWTKVRDTLVASHLLATNHGHRLDQLCIEYLGVDIEPFEVAVKEVTQTCRAIVKRDYPSWRIAEEGLPEMPSVRGSSKRNEDKPWKNDMWLPRALVKEWHKNADALWDRVAMPTMSYSGRAVGDIPDVNEWPKLESTCSRYANADSEHTLYLGLELERLIRERGLWAIYEHRLHLPRVACEMESYGITAIGEYTEGTIRDYEEHIAEAEDALCAIAAEYGHELELAEGASINDNMRDFFYGAVLQSCPRCTYTRRVKHWNGEGQAPWLEPPVCPRCARTTRRRTGVSHQLVTTRRENLGLPVVYSPKSHSATLDKTAMDEYLTTTEGNAYEFVKLLTDKRKHGTDLSYMESYRRFWVPVPGAPGYYRIHPSLNPCGTDHLRWASNSPNCFDAETEVLTTDGWVRADNLTNEYAVAQYWRVTGAIDFVKPSRVIKERFHGWMQHIKTDEQIDLLVTPDHRCLLQDRKTLRKFEVPASHFKDDCRHINAGMYVGGCESLTPDEVTWLCAVQADGSYDHGNGIKFSFLKERKIQRLRNCLISLQADYSEKVTGGLVTFYVKKANDIVDMARAMMPDKCFGAWLLECSRDTLDNFLSEVFQWDGDYTREAVYSSSDKVNADWIQIVNILSNSRANIATRMPNNAWAIRDHHYVNITRKRNYSLTTNHTRKQVAWDDFVYCVTVPSSYIVVRRNGKVSITGNCQNISVQEEECEECDGAGCGVCGGTGKSRLSVRRCFGPAPGREWWDMDFRNLEKRVPVYECGEESLIEVFEKPDEPPYWGSDHNVLASLLFPDEYWPLAEVRDGFKKKHLGKYKRVKNTNFAKQYGAGKRKVDATAGVVGAYELIERGLPKIASLQEYYLATAIRTGWVQTLPDRTVDPTYGYPILASRTEDGRVLSTTPFNYHVSGTACWIKNTGLVRCANQCACWRVEGFDAHVVLEVHDSILFDLPRGSTVEDNLPRALVLRRLMEQGGEDLVPRIPTPVSVEYITESWAEGVSV